MTSRTDGTQLIVTTRNGMGTQHSVINWQSFSIPTGSSTYFQQPSSDSTSINRVVTNTPSQLFGTLGSNGHLVLVNQAGITVGAGAVVDTASFTASALKMSDADALAGRLRFGDGAVGGAVSVQGQVLARSGDVVLIGSNVDTGKDALIQASNGSTLLAAGNQVEITGRGLEGISMMVQAPENNAVNLGTLRGDAVGIFAGTLKHSGAIQATRATLEGGKVVLKAAGDAIVDGNATITATGTTGGRVDVLGQRVGLIDQARIDVSGAQGGGQVRVGGDYQGKNAEVANAQFTYVGKDVNIQANASDKGNGGRVIVWADDTTRAHGSIEAKGGANGGNGGFVETSGKKALDVAGARVRASATAGVAGTWLLDPADVTITSSVSYNESFDANPSLRTLFAPTAGTSLVGKSDLEAALNVGTNVVVTTYDTTLNPGSMSGGAGDITVAAALNWTSSASLTLDAYRSIIVSSTGGSITATSGMLKMLASNRPSATDGSITNQGSGLIKVNKLEAVANGNISLTGYNEIQNLAAKSVAGSITVESSHSAGLTVTSVGGNTGVQAATGVTLQQYSSGGIAVNADVKSSSGLVKIGVASGSGALALGSGVIVKGQQLDLYTSGGNLQLAGQVYYGVANSSAGSAALNIICSTGCGAISQSGGGLVDVGQSTLTVSGGSGAGSVAVALVSTSNDFYRLDVTQGQSVSVVDANDIEMNAVASGDLNVRSVAGAIRMGANGYLKSSSAVSLEAATGIGTSANAVDVYYAPQVKAKTATGGIYLQSTTSGNSPDTTVHILGLDAGAGDIVVTNYGGINVDGVVSAKAGIVTLTANSPLTVNSTGGVAASGNITLTAASTGNMTLNGAVKSSLGSVSLSASGGTLTQNSFVYGAKGVSANASAVVYGANALTSGSPINYTTGSTAVAPPPDPIALASVSGALVVMPDDVALATDETATQLAQKDADQEATQAVVSGEVCLP